MHKTLFCQNLLTNALGTSIHKARQSCLTRFISDLLDYDTQISLTEIGKKLSSDATVKSKIKAANYFVSNYKLERDIPIIYKELTNFFWGAHQKLVVLVDWTGGCDAEYWALEASVASHGRSIPIYHEMHHISEQEKHAIHEQFLENLAEIIPSNVHVTIITDAGFRRNWFEQVLALGWDVIGRIYSRYKYQIEAASNVWLSVKDMKFAKEGKAKAIGKIKLGKTKTSLSGYLYAYKEKLSGKIRKKKSSRHDQDYSKYYKNGWVIFSSINQNANVLVKFYKTRMQIEQNFRDIKNERWGMGLRRNNSSGKTRVNMLFFLATLLIIICWWFGLMIETQGRQYQFQANSIKHKRVRSLVHLARLALRHKPQWLDFQALKQVILIFEKQYFTFLEIGKLS